eukprot:gb/GECG01012864.1/.p1 GENE.gb/GECG01012864.1/~~gb/GECG01012864.1/.p1  ORF type:complete len:109 (+),score=3.70 gb/GECG01012864.1/:1-327(+)
MPILGNAPPNPFNTISNNFRFHRSDEQHTKTTKLSCNTTPQVQSSTHMCMYNNVAGEAYVHVCMYIRSAHTILCATGKHSIPSAAAAADGRKKENLSVEHSRSWGDWV